MVTYGFFNSVYGDRKYDADQMSDFYTGIVTQGVFQHVDNGLEVTAGTGLTVSVNTGRAIIQNKWIKNDTPMVLQLVDAPSTYSRFDIVVLRYDASNRNVQILVKTGTPLGTPVVPELIRDGSVYEMCLAVIDVDAGATSVTVTDTRSDSAVCGWAAVAQATSGEVDQMLEDIELGYDGTVYSSPGAAVRGQVISIENRINKTQVKKNVPVVVAYGTYYTKENSTAVKVYNNIMKSIFVDVHEFSVVYYSNETYASYDCDYLIYDENKNLIKYKVAAASQRNDDIKLVLPANAYYVAINSRSYGIDPSMDAFMVSSIELENVSDDIIGAYTVKETPTHRYASVSGSNVTFVTNEIYRVYDIPCKADDVFYVSGFLPGASALSLCICLDENDKVIYGTAAVNSDTTYNDYAITIPQGCVRLIVNGQTRIGVNLNVKKRTASNITIDNSCVNKKYGALGDSITYGATVNTNYPEIVGKLSNLVWYNYGISGGRLASTSYDQTVAPMCTRYEDMSDDLDIITVCGGTNDCAAGVPIGTDDSTDITTFKGALNVLCVGLLQKYEGKAIGFITPPQRIDTYNTSLKSYADAIKTICAKYAIPVLDLYSKGGICSNTPNLLTDGLHPSASGQNVIARKVANFIKQL